MLVAALDTSVVVSGIGWAGGAARQVMVLLARRAFVSVRTADLTAEWSSTIQELAQQESLWSNPNWAQWLDWVRRKSVLVTPSLLKPTVRRDPDDDVVLVAALGARASYLVSYDRDLLDLRRPFGIQVIRPEVFVSRLLSF